MNTLWCKYLRWSVRQAARQNALVAGAESPLLSSVSRHKSTNIFQEKAGPRETRRRMKCEFRRQTPTLAPRNFCPLRSTLMARRRRELHSETRNKSRPGQGTAVSTASGSPRRKLDVRNISISPVHRCRTMLRGECHALRMFEAIIHLVAPAQRHDHNGQPRKQPRASDEHRLHFHFGHLPAFLGPA